MPFSHSSIKRVNLEITSRCNASCPMCARNIQGGPVIPDLSLTELRLPDVQQILPPEFVTKLDFLWICGTTGEPCIGTDTIPVFRYLREHNDRMELAMHTNASARKTEWWSELGSILSRQGDWVKFGIDGLEDTNHIYRRGTQWDKVMENAEAFISAGGRAVWQFIVFQHNEHQIEEARALSQRMGFTRFFVLRSGRWGRSGKTGLQVQDRDGNYEYTIYPPSDPEKQHPSADKRQAIIDSYGSWDKFLDGVRITCMAQRDREMYVDHTGLIFPCCHLAGEVHRPMLRGQLHHMLDGDWSNINALVHPLRDILEGQYYQRIEDSWGRASVADGRLKKCAQECNHDVAWDDAEGR